MMVSFSRMDPVPYVDEVVENEAGQEVLIDTACPLRFVLFLKTSESNTRCDDT